MNKHNDAYETDEEITIRMIRPFMPMPLSRKDAMLALATIIALFTTLGYLIIE